MGGWWWYLRLQVEGSRVAMENQKGRVVHVEDSWMGRCEGCCWYEHGWSWL